MRLKSTKLDQILNLTLAVDAFNGLMRFDKWSNKLFDYKDFKHILEWI